MASESDRLEPIREPGIFEGQAHGSEWLWVLACGFILLAGGAISLVEPRITALGISFIIGWMLLLVGVVGIVMGVRARRRTDRWSNIAYGIIALATAAVLLFDPVVGALGLAIGIALWLVVRGGLELSGAFRRVGRLRGWLLAIGIVDLSLAALLLANFPHPTIEAMGLFIGASLLVGGLLTLIVAFGLRRTELVTTR